MARSAAARCRAKEGSGAQAAAAPPGEAREAALVVLPPSEGGPPPDLKAIRARLLSMIANNAESIFAGQIRAAAGGGYMAARFLAEFAGLLQPAPDEDDAAQETLLTLLFRRLDEECGPAGGGAAAP
jgi:hypothetical protein